MDSIAFATEPVFASLANILGKSENTPSPPNLLLKNYKLFDVEIKYGLLQVGEGLSFLHNDAKILHHSLTPENIVINQQGAWKIFGFDFCILNSQPAAATAVWPWYPYKTDVHPLAQPDLDYLAPECGLAESNSAASDMYSLGVLITALYNDGQPLLSSNKDWLTYKKNMNELKQLPLSRLMCVAEGLRDMVRLMLNVKPELRPDEHEFIKMEFFNDVGVKTLNYLDSLFQWDNLQKSQFYKGLPEIIEKLPHRVSLYRVIPCLVKEFVNPTMVPFVLPNVLSIAENCTKGEFSQLILPHLKPVMKMTDPIQILLIFMQKMELLLKLCPCEEVKSDVLPMLYRALETDAQQIQELCLSVLPTYASLIEYPAMKNALLPRIKRLCISTSFISVRVNCLVCVGKLLEHLDKWLVLDEVLPFLPQIPSREPAVLMGILGIYKLVLTHKKMTMTKEVMATKVIPFLMPLSIENALTLNQFNAIIAVIKEMVNRVEGEHRVKLEQLNSIQNEQQNLDSTMASQLTSAPPTRSEFEEILGMLPSPPKPTVTLNSDISTLAQSKPLSLQDKQGVLKEQDAVRRLQQEPVLNPTQAVSKGPPPVKDLTMSLMENNLKQITLSGLAPPVAPATAPVAPVTAWTGQPWRPPVQPQAWQSGPVTFPAPQFQLTTNKVPMNTMVSQNTFPNSTMNGMKTSQPTKQLSSTEINDFLS
uniref:Protein kinase domain-containing protein n=1 Tax=Graphocephala atropunctata TaxID=36148 RepID=A0A1B6KRA0_9HEMI